MDEEVSEEEVEEEVEKMRRMRGRSGEGAVELSGKAAADVNSETGCCFDFLCAALHYSCDSSSAEGCLLFPCWWIYVLTSGTYF